MCFITTMFMTDQKPNRCYSFVQFLCFVCPFREKFFSFTSRCSLFTENTNMTIGSTKN